MYNNDFSSELPSAGQLIRSTILALIVAAVLLVTVVLPAEYAIDPTGIGRTLGLTQMGEIKHTLAEEAAAPAKPAPKAVPASPAAPLAAAPAAQSGVPVQQHSVTIKLVPNQGAELKLGMMKGAKVSYSWSANGGFVNHDTHGDPYNGPKDVFHSYSKGIAVPEDAGTIEAVFDGVHGWYWKNRTDKDVTITLTTEGEYSTIERVL